MKVENLELHHKALLWDRFKKIDTNISEYSFSNLYLFRNSHNYQVVFDDDIFVMGKTYDNFSYVMPTFAINETKIDFLLNILTNADFIFPVHEDWLKFFDLNLFQVSFEQGDSDYVYETENIAFYPGKKLHSKRNLVHQFETLYKYHTLPLTQPTINDAIAILNEWQIESNLTKEETDYYPTLEAITLNEELVLCGIVYYVFDEPAGFIIGEELNKDTFALHFAKAKTKFKGIYQFMFSSFNKLLTKNYKYVNFEQDLNKENLRQSKLSYAPDFMLQKYRVSIKK